MKPSETLSLALRVRFTGRIGLAPWTARLGHFNEQAHELLKMFFAIAKETDLPSEKSIFRRQKAPFSAGGFPVVVVEHSKCMQPLSFILRGASALNPSSVSA